MIITFKELKRYLTLVDRNTLETTVMKHLLRISADDIHTDILYNAESEQTVDDISVDRYNFIIDNIDSSCPDLYPKKS